MPLPKNSTPYSKNNTPYAKNNTPYAQGMVFYQDVGYGLRRVSSQKSRKFRMPVVYSNSLADFDNWDTMFMERLMGGITMHKPLVAPTVVLALGNGSDYWAIRAAQEWPKSRVTAHSLLGVHKDGMNTLIRSMKLADRVTYVRGDPSKELHLDYPNNTFDMVRLSYCSLNLAETEWYVFLQEVNRVLKPGGVLEVIDEDLLFPGHRPQFNGKVPGQQGRPKSGSVPPLSAGLDSRFMLAPDTRAVDVRTIVSTSLCSTLHVDSQDDWNRSEGTLSTLQHVIDMVDHSRLSRAWHEMLTSRWISASITSVLPFYLSAIFQHFRALPALEVFIGPGSTLSPGSSKRSQQKFDPEAFRHLGHATVKDDAESSMTWMPASEAPPHFISSHAQMHLARMVAIVASCKEAIWGAYNKLYCEDRRSPRPNDALGKTNALTMREEFEYYWINWECDMRSRIDMTSNIQQRLHWNVRLPPRPEPDSDSGRWLKGVNDVRCDEDLIGLASSLPEKPEVVRCVRGFVAWKFGGTSIPEANLPNRQEQVSRW